MDAEHHYRGLIESLTPEELDQLKQAVTQRISKEGNSLMATYFDVERAAQCIDEWSKAGNVLKIYYDDTFSGIFAFDITQSWWSKIPVIAEICIFSLGNAAGLQRFALAYMHEVAKQFPAIILAGGCIFQQHPQMVTNCYKRMGFTEAYPTYTKVMRNDNR